MTAGFSASLGLARSLAIYYGMPWRRRSLHRFYSGLIHHGDLVFDIGAHVGSRSRTLMSLGAKVVAVEPQPLFSDFLAKHLGRDLLALERVAVGRRAGEVALHISSRHPTVTSISTAFLESAKNVAGFSNVAWDRTIIVPMITLDTLIARYGCPSFCKIDVEGAEADILKGTSQPLPLVAFEYIPSMPEMTEAALDAIDQLGSYRFNRVIGESHRFHHRHWIDGQTLRDDLRLLPKDAPSGDVYARLLS